MADINISSKDGLINATVKERKETYYLVTKDMINSIKGKSLLCDLFLLLASLGWGAYLSATITIDSLPTSSNDTENNAIETLKTLSSIFIGGALLFTLLTTVLYWISYNGLKQITTGKVDIIENK